MVSCRDYNKNWHGKSTLRKMKNILGIYIIYVVYNFCPLLLKRYIVLTFMCVDRADVADDEVQWRLARVTHDKAKHEKDKHKRQNWMLEAFSYAEKALEMNSNSPHTHRVGF